MARIDYIYLVDGKEVTLFDLEMATGLTGQGLRMRFKNPKLSSWIRIPRKDYHLRRECNCCNTTYIRGMTGGRLLCNDCYKTNTYDDDETFPIHIDKSIMDFDYTFGNDLILDNVAGEYLTHNEVMGIMYRKYGVF